MPITTSLTRSVQGLLTIRTSTCSHTKARVPALRTARMNERRGDEAVAWRVERVSGSAWSTGSRVKGASIGGSTGSRGLGSRVPGGPARRLWGGRPQPRRGAGGRRSARASPAPTAVPRTPSLEPNTNSQYLGDSSLGKYAWADDSSLVRHA
eukprot:1493403-Rhodomonas_salina.1